jgi:multisubunit Na+/H+ antiporter MnhF subunit
MNMNFTETVTEYKTDFIERLEHTAVDNNKEEYKEAQQIMNSENIYKNTRVKKSSLTIKMFAFLAIIAVRIGFSSYTNNAAEKSVREPQIDSLINKSTAFAGDSEGLPKKHFLFSDLFYSSFNKQFTNKRGKNYLESTEINPAGGFIAGGSQRNKDDVKAIFSFAALSGVNHHSGHLNLSDGIHYLNDNTAKIFSILAFAGTVSFSNYRGKSFSIPTYTLGRWKQGVIIAEYLFLQ